MLGDGEATWILAKISRADVVEDVGQDLVGKVEKLHSWRLLLWIVDHGQVVWFHVQSTELAKIDCRSSGMEKAQVVEVGSSQVLRKKEGEKGWEPAPQGSEFVTSLPGQNSRHHNRHPHNMHPHNMH